MNRVLKVLGFILLGIVTLVLVTVLCVFINNKVQLNKEAKKIDNYGEKIDVNNEKMNITVLGEGAETIVLLPGYMTASPTIDFKPLTDELAKDHKVVVIEPLGYGLSDDTDRERSVENLTEEIHEAVKSLGVDRYTLMGHSISGIYSLEYIKNYPDEVEAFVGIDSSLPQQGGADDNQVGQIKFLSQSGLFRLLTGVAPDMLNLPPVDKELQTQYKYLSLKNIGSKATMNEGESMPENFKKTMNITYPKELPVLYLLANESTDSDPSWLTIHQDMVKNSDKYAIKILKGEHYLHHTKAKEIAHETKAFLK